MQMNWDRASSHSLPGGMVQYIFERMKALTGCVTGGPARCCQNFLTKNFTVRDIQSNCHHLQKKLREWNGQLEVGTLLITGVAQRKDTHTQIASLASNCKHMGLFSVSHIVHSAALLCTAPLYFLDYAAVASSATQNKKAQ